MGSTASSTARVEDAFAGDQITGAVELGVTCYYANRTSYLDPERQKILESTPQREHAVNV